MAIPIRMSDPRLAGFVDVYGHWHLPMESINTFGPGLIAFNFSGKPVVANGVPRHEPVLMGIANDPATIEYSIFGGDIVSLRVLPNAYDRLLHVDPSDEQGIVAMVPDRHPRIARIFERLKVADPTPESWFATLDEVLLELLEDVKPIGLIGRMMDLIIASERFWTVSELADELGCSKRTLERATMKRYGRTPQRLLRAERINRTRRLELASEGRIELEEQFPFADLPHYLNELRRIYGLNRKQLSDDRLLGNDFPYDYIWPDGRVAQGPEEEDEWRAEMDERFKAYRG